MQEGFFTPTRRRLLFAGTAALPVLAGARTVAPSAAGEGPGGPPLADVYAGQVDLALCLVSEKYDGVRAVWDGRVLRHRSGRPVAAPVSFVKTLPREPVDGELRLGRGRLDELSAIVRRREPREAEWAPLRYRLFELPGAGGVAPAPRRAARPRRQRRGLVAKTRRNGGRRR